MRPRWRAMAPRRSSRPSARDTLARVAPTCAAFIATYNAAGTAIDAINTSKAVFTGSAPEDLKGLKLRNGLRERRLRHVQALGGTAKMQFIGHGEKLPPQTKLNQKRRTRGGNTGFHIQHILIHHK